MTERESNVMEADAPVAGAEPVEPNANGAAAQPVAAATPEETNAFLSPPEPGPANPSPDGATLAYLQADAGGALSLWLGPLDGGEPRALATAVDLLPDEDGPQWSPDGATLAVAGAHPDDGRSAI